MKKFLITSLFLSVSLLAMSATKNYNGEQAKKDLASKGYTVTKEDEAEYSIVKGVTKIQLKEYENENSATLAFSELLKNSYSSNDVIVPEKSNVRKGIFVFKDSKIKDGYILYGNGIQRPVVVDAHGTEKDIREALGILKKNRKPVHNITIDPFEMREPIGIREN